MARSGLVIIDKPGGMTSHDVVARVRRIAGTRKVGHAGTLDPMATGVLVVGVERATKLLGYLGGHDKTYRATVRLGVATGTDDAEGALTSAAGASGVTGEQVRAGLRGLTGEIEQVPSSVSAIKVDGRRAYDLVRAGQDVRLAPRRVRVDAIDVHGMVATTTSEDGREVPVLDVDIEVRCSAGTYIRAIARDLGAALGAGGHLTALRRTVSGSFSEDQALTLAALAGLAEPVVISLDDAVTATFPVRSLTDSEAADLSHGRRIPGYGETGTTYGAVDAEDRAVALLDDTGRPVVVFRPA